MTVVGRDFSPKRRTSSVLRSILESPPGVLTAVFCVPVSRRSQWRSSLARRRQRCLDLSTTLCLDDLLATTLNPVTTTCQAFKLFGVPLASRHTPFVPQLCYPVQLSSAVNGRAATATHRTALVVGTALDPQLLRREADLELVMAVEPRRLAIMLRDLVGEPRDVHVDRDVAHARQPQRLVRPPIHPPKKNQYPS